MKAQTTTGPEPVRLAEALAVEELSAAADGAILTLARGSGSPDILLESATTSNPIADADTRPVLRLVDGGTDAPSPPDQLTRGGGGSAERPETLGIDAACSLILGSGLFDAIYYQRQSGLEEQQTERLIRHYLQHGAAAGLDPNPLFDTDWYAHTNPEVAASGMNPFAYYLAEGAFHTSPHPLFDLVYYREQNSAFMESFKNPLLHYYTEGWFAGQDPHPLFSVQEYLDGNPDVRAAVCEPLSHYISTGWEEGRNPSRYFDTKFYLENSPDVAKAGLNPFAHYLQYGFLEGRNPSPDFESAWYLSQLDPAEVKRDLNPLIHYRLFGESRGISPKPRRFVLAADFSLAWEDFQLWTRRLATARSQRNRAIERDELALTLVWSDGKAVDGNADDSVFVGDPPSVPVAIRSTAWATWRRTERQQRIDPPGAAAKETARAREACLFLERSDRIDARFLTAVLEPLTRGARIVLFDLVYESGGRAYPLLQPGANRAHIEATDAIFSRFVIAADLLTSVLDNGPAATAYEVLRRAMQQLRTSGAVHAITHVAAPFLRVPDLSSEIARQRRALVQAATAPSPAAAAYHGFTCSVVICTKQRGHLLLQLVDGLRRFPADVLVDIAIVANQTSNEFAAACHAALRADPRVTVIDHERPFNFSAQSNIGARSGRGELLLFLNDDIVPIGTAWLPRLAQAFADDRVAVAGPLLLYPDERIQHAGMYLGFNNCAGHTLRGAQLVRDDYVFMASARRHVTAVTGAALLTRRDVFERLNGFDCQLGTYLQDVDYCLRALNLDMDIVYEPAATLLHMESLTMQELADAGELLSQRTLEHRHFMRRWGTALKSDPYHNPNFELTDEHLLSLTVPSRE